MDRTVETYGAVLLALEHIEGREEAKMREDKAHLLALSAISTCPKLRGLDAGRDLDCSRCAFGPQGAMPLCHRVKKSLGLNDEHDGEHDGRGE